MKLYLLTQNTVPGWDTFDSMVVAAHTVFDALEVHPTGYIMGEETTWREGRDWPSLRDTDQIKVEYLGATDHVAGVICASFNAG